MRETLATLINLQDIDSELRLLELSKGDLPQRVAALSQEISRCEEAIAAREAQLSSSHLDRQSKSLDVAHNRERLKKYQSQLYQVKNNKEYDAITLELETTQKAIESTEFQILELEEREKGLQQEISEIQPQQATAIEQRRELEEKLTIMLAATQVRETELLQQRQAIAAKLSRPVYSTYERIRQGRSGIAVAFLKEGSCSQCSTRIPPQRGLEIRMMNQLFVCEVCGRIMLWDAERDSVAIPKS